LFLPKSAKKGTSTALLPNKASKDKLGYGAVPEEDPESGKKSGHSHSDHTHAHATTASGKTDHKHDEHKSGHGHDQKKDLNIEAAYLHVVTDLIQSVGVAIAGLLIWIFLSGKSSTPSAHSSLRY